MHTHLTTEDCTSTHISVVYLYMYISIFKITQECFRCGAIHFCLCMVQRNRRFTRKRLPFYFAPDFHKMVPFIRYSISKLSSFAIYHLTYGSLHVFASQKEFSFSDSMAFRLKRYGVDANTFVSRWAPFNFTRAEHTRHTYIEKRDAHTHTMRTNARGEATTRGCEKESEK